MFKGHPKGLYALALANTGERFGYYTMLAIFVLFLQAKFGLSAQTAGQFYGIFLAAVYFMPIIGGYIADKFWGFGKTVVTGILVMFAGYLLLFTQKDATGSMAFTMMIIALLCIAIGTGLFKGNLQVMVGNLYDDAKYAAKRDGGFSLFYMAINIGSMFAPTTATAVTNLFLGKNGLTYDANIPSLAHQYLDGTITLDGAARLQTLAEAQSSFGGDMTAFCHNYIDSLSVAYSYGFGVACISLILSIAIYFGFRKSFKHVDVRKGEKSAKEEKVVELTPKQTKERVVALCRGFVSGVCCRDLLLDGVPAGRTHSDIFRPRLHRLGGDRLDAHRIRCVHSRHDSRRRLRLVRSLPERHHARPQPVGIAARSMRRGRVV